MRLSASTQVIQQLLLLVMGAMRFCEMTPPGERSLITSYVYTKHLI
ncbi:hypothetical protein ACWATR_38075 [Nostoc sp. UIC 10890]